MMPVSAETMRELDRMASMSGLSTLSLMENAGEAVANKAVQLLKAGKGSRIAIFCGRGNNGGDGFVAARKLKAAGYDVTVYLLGSRHEIKNEASVNFRLFAEGGGTVKDMASPADIETLKNELSFSLSIDALLGTGFSGSVSGPLEKLIRLLNSSHLPVLAIDVPSGLNATTGEVNPVAVKAKWTISFAMPKRGFYEKCGKECAGAVQVVNIGFPDELLKRAIEYERKRCAALQ